MPASPQRHRTRRRNSAAVALATGDRPPPSRNPYPGRPFPRPPPDASRRPPGLRRHPGVRAALNPHLHRPPHSALRPDIMTPTAAGNCHPQIAHRPADMV